MATHEEKLKTEIEELQTRLKILKGRRVYKEDFEEEMRDIIDALNIIVSSYPMFSNFTGLELPEKMDSEWFDYEVNEDEDEAFDLLKRLIKESERSCKQLLTLIKTLPKEKKMKEEITKRKIEPKPIKAPKITKIKENDVTIPTKIRVGTSTFIESTFKLTEKEYVIFIIGLFLGFIIGVVLE